MCNPAAGILIKSKVLWGKNSNHEDIIKYNKLDDTKEIPDFVRFEISPPDNDFVLPLEKWVYKVDQDILPDWYNERKAIRVVRRTLPEWYRTHVFTEGEHECVDGMEIIACGTAVVNQSGGECRNIYENAVVNKLE